MKTTIAMLALCGLFIGGAAWGHLCPEGEGTTVDQTASPPAQGLSDYEALRPRYSTLEEANRRQRRWAKENDVYPYQKASYPALKAEYMAWELLQEIKGLNGKSGDEHDSLRPRYSTLEEANRRQRRWAKENDVYPYQKASYPALKTEYILWEILKLVRSEGFCK